MKTLSTFVVTGFLFFSAAVLATAGQMTIYGTLAGYDQSTARVTLENGEVAIVPKSSIQPAVEGMVVGKAKVAAQVDAEELFRLNPRIAAKFRQPNSKHK